VYSNSREEIAEAFDALHAARLRVNGLSFDALTTPERLAYLEHLEHDARRAPVPGHALINQLGEQADEKSLGGDCPQYWPHDCGSAARKRAGG
jgi:hypothetical protein